VVLSFDFERTTLIELAVSSNKVGPQFLLDGLTHFTKINYRMNQDGSQ
jgi:hypothetical protein